MDNLFFHYDGPLEINKKVERNFQRSDLLRDDDSFFVCFLRVLEREIKWYIILFVALYQSSLCIWSKVSI